MGTATAHWRADPRSQAHLRRRLLAWYRRHRRPLPWRGTRDPYRIWVSETMLQQTQVTTVIPFYHSFLERFPTVADLARAPEPRVLAAWSGLGYYRRARRLRSAAQLVVREHGGGVPDTPEAFGRLPGVGRYTAGAVLSIAFDRPLPVLDGNVARVLCRLLAAPWQIREPRGARCLWAAAEALVPPRGAGEWNQALMELGATVCTPREPRCEECPARSFCCAYALGRVGEFPPAAPRRRSERVRRAVAVIERGGRLLVARREGELLGGLWEPPGVEVSDGASARRALGAELARLGLCARLAPLGVSIRHGITHRSIEAELWRGSVIGAGPPRSPRLRFVAPNATPVGLTALARKVARLLLGAGLVGALAAALGAPALAAAPPVQLVETVPVESDLGNPALPATAGVWVEMIDGAKRSVDIEHFYLSSWPGEPLEDVLTAIGQAARRGVKIRMLLDARMHRTYPMPADSLGKLPGVTLRLLDMGRIAGGVQHAKFFLVDGRESFLGSQNLDWRALKHIHELGVRVRHPRLARVLGQVFEMDWAAARDSVAADSAARTPIVQQRVEVPIRIVQAPGDTAELWPSYSPKRFIPDTTRWDRDAIVRRLGQARREVVLQLLTYSPVSRGETDSTLDAAIRRAAARGVKVKLLVSDWETDGPAIESLQSLARVPGIEARLSTVPEWSGGYIPYARVEHCKYMVVDSLWTWVGTSNWEPGYFHGSRNVAVTLRHRALALQARRIFETSWTAPGADSVRPEARYEPKVHGSTPPAGRGKYGE